MNQDIEAMERDAKETAQNRVTQRLNQTADIQLFLLDSSDAKKGETQDEQDKGENARTTPHFP